MFVGEIKFLNLTDSPGRDRSDDGGRPPREGGLQTQVRRLHQRAGVTDVIINLHILFVPCCVLHTGLT